jgi:hypothetical protein
MPPHTRRRLAGGLLAVGLLAFGAATRAEQATAPALKAAFLYNFAKFAEWPAVALPAGQPLSLCVVGDDGVAEALEQTIDGYAIDDHELVVTVLDPQLPGTACHLLYVSASHLKRANAMLSGVVDAPVLTVSDANGFAVSGGIAELIVQRNQIRFALNAAAAGRARIRLSSRLLRLAHAVQEQRP